MYVDKKLGGVGAVQTLSRLNRTCSRQGGNVPFWTSPTSRRRSRRRSSPTTTGPSSSEGTDPNLLHDLQDELADFHFYGTDDVERFASIYFNPKSTQDKLFAALEPVVDRYKAAEDDEQRKASARR